MNLASTTDPSAMAMTVLGPVPVAELGATQVHEHLYLDCRPLLRVHNYPVASEDPLTLETAAAARWNPGGYPDNYHQTDEDQIVAELVPFRAAGGGTIVEVTPSHLSRNPRALRRISERSGIHVVMGGGYYLASTHPPEVDERSIEDIATELVDEWSTGVGDSGIRPGILGEIGTSDPLHPDEERILRAVALTHHETGLAVSIHVHPWGFEGARVLDVLESQGVNPRRVILGHMNTAVANVSYLCDLLSRDTNLGFDLMGFDHSLIGLGKYPPSDFDVVTRIVDLAERGFAEQLFVSQDMGGVKTRLLAYGGWGYAHILNHVIPLFRRAGWGDQEVDGLMITNPATLLAVPGLRPLADSRNS